MDRERLFSTISSNEAIQRAKVFERNAGIVDGFEKLYRMTGYLEEHDVQQRVGNTIVLGEHEEPQLGSGKVVADVSRFYADWRDSHDYSTRVSFVRNVNRDDISNPVILAVENYDSVSTQGGNVIDDYAKDPKPMENAEQTLAMLWQAAADPSLNPKYAARIAAAQAEQSGE
jgi:hypothetical protein